MHQGQSITLYNWILQEFTIDARADFLNLLTPHIKPFLQPGDHVLDLCCGTGPVSFWLEEQDAIVTAIDFAPYMINLALQTAVELDSAVNFIQADVLSSDLPLEYFDLVLFLGNTLSDFPISSFRHLGHNVYTSLKANKGFIIHYIDGFYEFIQGTFSTVGVQQEKPVRITRSFKEYLPEKGAYVDIYKNEATGEVYEYTSYLYNPPIVRRVMSEFFEFEQSIRLTVRSFFDVFVKR